jgi:hypothetical protein
LTQNSNGLAFGFNEKHLFMAKQEENPHFLRETYILARFDIMMLYTIFEVLKNIKLRLKSQMVSHRFYQQAYVQNENGSKICISSP